MVQNANSDVAWTNRLGALLLGDAKQDIFVEVIWIITIMTRSRGRLFPRVEFLLRISAKQFLDIIKEDRVAIALQDLSGRELFQCRQVQPLVQHGIGREAPGWSRIKPANRIFVPA